MMPQRFTPKNVSLARRRASMRWVLRFAQPPTNRLKNPSASSRANPSPCRTDERERRGWKNKNGFAQRRGIAREIRARHDRFGGGRQNCRLRAGSPLVLKSAGALTVALDSGTIHSYVDQEPSLTIYTALLQAKPLAIGGAAQETLVSLEANGGLSVRAIGGAVRIEQQLNGQSIVVPQSGDVFLSNGQLAGMKAGGGHGSCDLGELKFQPPPLQVSVPATAEEVKQRHWADTKPNLPDARSNSSSDEGQSIRCSCRRCALTRI